MATSYQAFLNNYNGRFVDYDGYYGAQCVDLVQFYAKELGLPTFSGNAADIANEYPAGWVHVSVPIQGDVLVFDRNQYNGYAGHIGLFDRPGWLFSQNYYPDKRSVVQPILANDRIIAIIRPTNLQGGTMGEDPNVLRAALNAERRTGVAFSLFIHTGQVPTEAQIKDWLDRHPSESVEAIDLLIAKAAPPGAGLGQPQQAINKDQVLNYLNQHLT